MPAHMTLKKPARGTAAKLRRARRRLVETRERAAKDAAKLRDNYTCRRCGFAARSWFYVEAAHLVNAGAGGNPDGSRGNKPSCYVTLCRDCHQGPRGVHAGFVKIVPLTDRGGDGPVEFVEIQPGNGKIGGTARGVSAPAPPLSTRRG